MALILSNAGGDGGIGAAYLVWSYRTSTSADWSKGMYIGFDDSLDFTTGAGHEVEFNTTAIDNEYMTLSKGNGDYWTYTIKKPCKFWHFVSGVTFGWTDLAAGATDTFEVWDYGNNFQFVFPS